MILLKQKKSSNLILFLQLILILTFFQLGQSETFYINSQTDFDSVMTSIGNNSARYSWSTLVLDGYDDSYKNTYDFTNISVISDLTQIKNLTIQFGKCQFNQVEFDKVMDAIKDYNQLSFLYIFFYAPQGSGTQITNINKVKTVLQNNSNINRLILHFGANALDDNTCSNLLPIQNMTQLNYELSFYCWSCKLVDISCLNQILAPLTTLKRLNFNVENNQVQDISTINDAFKNLSQTFYIHLNLRYNPFTVFTLQESFKDLPKLTSLALYISPKTGVVFENFTIHSNTITSYTIQMSQGFINHETSKEFFLNMPNLQTISFNVRYNTYSYQDLKFLTDQLKDNPQFKNWIFYSYYQQTSYTNIIDLSEWLDLFDEIRDKLQYVYYDQYQQYYNQDYSYWNQILRDTPNLWKLSFKQRYNLGDNVVHIPKIEHSGITHFYNRFERTTKIIDKWDEFSDIFSGLPKLKYNYFQCSYCGLTNENSQGFSNIYKSLVGRTFTDTFYLYLTQNSFTDVDFLVNPHGLINFQGFIYLHIQYNQLTNLNNLGPVLKSIAEPSTFSKFYMYMEYNQITDISGLQTAFNTFKMVDIYLEMEANDITDLGQMKGMLDGQGGDGTKLNRVRIYTNLNDIVGQSVLNEVFLPVTYYGKAYVNQYMLQLKDPSSTTQNLTDLKTNNKYPAIHDNGYCISQWTQAQYYYETTDSEGEIVKNCGNCYTTKCHSCSNSTQCDLCRYSVPARVLNNDCNCPDGYYDGDDYTCLQCSRLCATCDNGSDCLTCKTSNPSRTTNNCICPDNYYDDGTNIQCQPCINGCDICSNGSVCQDCLDGYYLNSSNICVKCPNKFSKCDSSTEGKECQGNNRSSLTPNCPCNTGYYDDNTKANCNICVNNCKTCTSDTVCQSCVTGYYLSGSTCVICPNKFSACQTSTIGDVCQGNNRSSITPNCNCNDGYFDDGTNKADCSQCQAPCKTCEQTNSKCLSCVDGYYLNGNSCIQCPNKFAKCSNVNTGIECQGNNRSSIKPNCPCNSGYYDDNTNANCNICVNNCSTCTSDVICQSCDDGYYLSGTSCPQCPNRFKTCLNNTTGQICQGNNRSSITPDCPCNNGYFDDGTNKADCTQCQSPCKTCENSSSNCLSCIDGYYLSGNSCIQCPNKYAKCSDAVTGIECQGNNRSAIKPNCPCNSGYYDDNTNANCNICVNNCSTCTSDVLCQSCDDGYYLQGTSCPQCLNKYKTCTNSSNGLICQGNNRSSITPDCHCNNGYFDDGTNKADCTQCQSPCKTCENSSSNCLSCIDGYYLSGNSCLQCPNKFAKCSDAVTGIQCQGDNRSSITPSCLCNDGYYDDDINSNCVQCQYPCKFCDKNKCLTCTDNLNRNQDDTCSCQTNYYDNTTNQACEQCYFRCNTCSSDFNVCDTCSHSTRDDIQNCICKETFYEVTDQAECELCVSPCINCTSETYCLSCLYDGQPFRNGVPTCNCQDGYYEDQNTKDCMKCPEKCSQCSDAFTCTECNSAEGDERTHSIDDNCGCNPGFFDDQTNNIQCQQCQYPCLQCESLDFCVIGQCSTLENRNLTSKLCSCSDGFYDNGQECQNCDLQCLTCHSTSSFCTGQICAGNGTRHKYPICECIDGLKEIGKAECGICANKCQECFGSETSCTVCAEGKGRLQINDNCVCKDSYYDDGVNSDCQECFSQCKTCSNAEYCDTCYADNLDPKLKCIQAFEDNKASFSVTNPVTQEVEVLECEIQCKSCQNQSNYCNECNIGINRQNTTPHCSCKIGYHDNNGTSIDCKNKCNSACYTCNDFDQCTTCDESKYWVMNVTTMMCECKNGYTQKVINNNTKICIECNFYYKGMCVQQCPESTLLDKSNKQCVDIWYQKQNNFIYIISIGITVILIKVMLFVSLRFLYNKFFGQKLQKIQYQSSLQKSQDNIKVNISNEDIPSSIQSPDNISSSKSSSSGGEKQESNKKARKSLRKIRERDGQKPNIKTKSKKQSHFIN